MKKMCVWGLGVWYELITGSFKFNFVQLWKEKDASASRIEEQYGIVVSALLIGLGWISEQIQHPNL